MGLALPASGTAIRSGVFGEGRPLIMATARPVTAKLIGRRPRPGTHARPITTRQRQPSQGRLP